MLKITHIHKDMLVGDAVGLFPEAAEIITSYGLHCVGCAYNAMETLEQGLLGHGYSTEELNAMIDDLNEAIDDLNKQGGDPNKLPPAAEEMIITMSKKAQEKMLAAALAEQRKKPIVRLEVRTVMGEFKYALNFVEETSVHDFEKQFSFPKLQLVADKRDYKKLDGLEIDYLDQKEKFGFKMNNPNTPKI